MYKFYTALKNAVKIYKCNSRYVGQTCKLALIDKINIIVLSYIKRLKYCIPEIPWLVFSILIKGYFYFFYKH